MEELFTFYRGEDVKNGDFFVDFSQKSISLSPKVLYFWHEKRRTFAIGDFGNNFL